MVTPAIGKSVVHVSSFRNRLSDTSVYDDKDSSHWRFISHG